MEGLKHLCSAPLLPGASPTLFQEGTPEGPTYPAHFASCPLAFPLNLLGTHPTPSDTAPTMYTRPPQGVLLNPDHRLPIRTWPREYWEARPPALAPPLPHSVTSAYPDGLGLLIHRIKLVLAKLGSRPIREGVLLTTTCPQTAPRPSGANGHPEPCPLLHSPLCHPLQHPW